MILLLSNIVYDILISVVKCQNYGNKFTNCYEFPSPAHLYSYLVVSFDFIDQTQQHSVEHTFKRHL